MQDEKRAHKRVHIARLAMISAAEGDYPAYVEDISAGGIQLRNASPDEEFDAQLAVGEDVRLDIEDISPLQGHVARIADPMVAIAFAGDGATDTDALFSDLMARQGLFGIVDPDTRTGD